MGGHQAPDPTARRDVDAAEPAPPGPQLDSALAASLVLGRRTRLAYRLGAAAFGTAPASVVTLTILVIIADPGPEPRVGVAPEPVVTRYYTSAMWIVPFVLLTVAIFALLVGLAVVYLRLRAEAERGAVAVGGVGTALTMLGLLLPLADFFVRAAVVPVLAQAGAHGALEQVLGMHMESLSPTLLAAIPVGALVLLFVLLWVGAMPRWATIAIAVGTVALVQTARAVEPDAVGFMGLVLMAVGLTGWGLSLWTNRPNPHKRGG